MGTRPGGPREMNAMSHTPHFLQPLLPTPFHERARALSQVDSFVPWSGYSTVDVFTSVEQEYFAIRNACSLYDLTPMVKYRIAGPDAERYLDRLVTRNVARLKPGRVAYAVLCDDAGQVIEDGTIFRLATDEFRLCMAERQLNWLLDSAIGFDVSVVEITDRIAALSLQGPTAWSVLRTLGVHGAAQLRPFDIGQFVVEGRGLTVSRTGFTGDLGYELWMDPADALFFWDSLMQAGQTRGIRAIGSKALNMARIEAGFIMPHQDFIPAESVIRTGRTRSPLELGLDWLVDFEKGHFTGRRALLAERRRGPARQLVGLDIDGNKPAHDALLYADRRCRKRVGAVTSAIWSPTCKRNIALALLDVPHFAVGSQVWAEIYLCRELEWETRVVAARVVERPFFLPDRRKLVPPALS
jgi:aminomethyltransferase